ncbi:hypothetical protein Q8A67_022670 [Cirrhinus molitorella]|uniref:Uncharacterized protein n=1 Tax=Cirrhinus molitorella TaxID=172907 RepID=A0AA88P799_9TELE|nr:hypothetical protein Q8A67_022670 [Cirrhinus molitorella]
MTLSSRPASVEELKTKIKEKFDLAIDFTLSFQDPDFDGQLCSLLDIEELPQKAVLIVVRSESGASSVASDDTVILPNARIPERAEICAEFHRVTNVNLKNRFFAQLDQHTPRLQSLFRKKASRTGKASELLDQLFKIYDLQDQVDVHVRRAAVLRALPSYMHESDVSFFKMWDVEQSDEPDINDVPLGLLLSNQTSSDACFFCPERIAVLIEDNICFLLKDLLLPCLTFKGEKLLRYLNED